MEKENKMLREIAYDIEKHLPEGVGFFVMVFPFNGVDGRTNYCSNGQRKDVLNCMKEFIIRSGAEENWMKHLD